MMLSNIVFSPSALLPFCLSFLRLASAAQWTIVQYEIVYMTASTDDLEPTLTFTDTTTVTLEPPVTATPTGRPTSIDTSYDPELDASYTTLYIPGSSLPSQQLASLTRSTFPLITSTPLTEFYIERFYTAPASCPKPFTFTTSSVLFVPHGAETNLSPTSAITTTSPDGDVWVTGFVAAGAVNLSATTTSTDFVQSEYIAYCTNPATFTSAGVYGSYPTGYNSGLHSGGDNGDDGYYDYHFGCLGSLCPFWLIYIVVIIPVLAVLFLGGLIESYYWFTRLMKGQSALRGVPLMWVAISLWTLCCLRRHHAANPEAQAELLKQWREMSSGQHIKLWLSYGFRHRDPPQLAAIVGRISVVPVWQSYNQPPYGPPPGGVMGPQPPQPPMGPHQSQQWQAAPAWTPQNGYSPYQNKSPYSPPPGSPPPQLQGYTYLPPQQQQMQQMHQMQQGTAPGQPTERGSFVPSPATSPSNAPAEPILHAGASTATPPPGPTHAATPPPGPIHAATPELQQPVPTQPSQHVEVPAHAVADARTENGTAQ